MSWSLYFSKWVKTWTHVAGCGLRLWLLGSGCRHFHKSLDICGVGQLETDSRLPAYCRARHRITSLVHIISSLCKFISCCMIRQQHTSYLRTAEELELLLQIYSVTKICLCFFIWVNFTCDKSYLHSQEILGMYVGDKTYFYYLNIIPITINNTNGRRMYI